MTQPPPQPSEKKPVLPYRTPSPSSLNTPGQVIARGAVGAFIGIAGCVAGFFMVASTGNTLTFFLPLILALVLAGMYALRQRKFGYFTGIILGPVILICGLAVLLLIICGTKTGPW